MVPPRILRGEVLNAIVTVPAVAPVTLAGGRIDPVTAADVATIVVPLVIDHFEVDKEYESTYGPFFKR